MEDDLNLFQMEDDLNILANGRQPQNKIMQPETIKIKTMVLAPSLPHNNGQECK